MRIAYLTNKYPSVSHTFIRRELQAIEARLGEVARFSIRPPPSELADPDDRLEDTKTFRVLSQPAARWVEAGVRSIRRPRDLISGLHKAIALGRRSERGLPIHLVYLAEAVLLRDELERRGIEHVHVHFGTNPTAVAQLVRAMGGPSYSFTVHGPDELDAPRTLSLGSKIEDAAFVVAITSFCAGQLRRWVAPSQWDKIRVVHCTVGDEFLEAARPIDPGSKRLVCVGRLCPQKGQILLVEAFADAVDHGVDAELVLAGDGELRADIERIVDARGLGDRVRITGWISGAQVRDEILASRAMVLPSFAEGLPMVLMEAFALGRPVLTTYIAGIPELVVDGHNGWLIASGSKDAITEGIARVMATPDHELETMAEHGRAAVRRGHYTPVEADKLLAHFRAAVSR